MQMTDPFADLGATPVLACEPQYHTGMNGYPTEHGPATHRIEFSAHLNVPHVAESALICDACVHFWQWWIGVTFLRLTSERADRSTGGLCENGSCRDTVPLEDLLRITPLEG